jgi:hypothetical protein
VPIPSPALLMPDEGCVHVSCFLSSRQRPRVASIRVIMSEIMNILAAVVRIVCSHRKRQERELVWRRMLKLEEVHSVSDAVDTIYNSLRQPQILGSQESGLREGCRRSGDQRHRR